MLNIPAVCSCGLVFPSGIVIGDVTNITLRGNKSQCPRCGRMADIPDAILSSYNGAVEVLQAGNYSQAQILGFFNVLQKTYVQLKSNKSTSFDETIENIEVFTLKSDGPKDGAPRAGSPRTPARLRSSSCTYALRSRNRGGRTRRASQASRRGGTAGFQRRTWDDDPRDRDATQTDARARRA